MAVLAPIEPERPDSRPAGGPPVDILALLGGDLRVTAWTPTAQNLWGYRADEALDKSATDLLAEPDDVDLAEMFAAHPWAGRMRLSQRHGPGRQADLRVSPLDGRSGWLLWSSDATTRTGREGIRTELLRRAEGRIGRTLDPMETAQALAEVAVPALADYVTVDVVESPNHGDVPLTHLKSSRSSLPAFYRAGAASIHPDFPEALSNRGSPVFVPPQSPFTYVLTNQRSHFEPILDTSEGTWLDNDPDRARIIQDTGMHSVIIVPLQARGATLGIAVFVRTENQAAFTPSDLALSEELCARAALNLDNALRYTRERTTALALQRDLLPRNLSCGHAMETACRYLPSDNYGGVGGDWYDVIPLPDARIALVVGDVIGHGINAAATMGRLRTVVRTLAKLNVSPGDLLTHLDELAAEMAHDSCEEHSTYPVFGATCLYVVYEPRTQRCTMASAGHPPPAILTPSGRVDFAELSPGAPIGTGLTTYTSTDCHIAEGSVLALYTDGLIETRHSDIAQRMERLRTALAHPTCDLDALCTSVIDSMELEEPAGDDIALLLARTPRLDRELHM